MALIDAILMEFQQEAATTRRMLEVLPDEHFGWKPHEKSMTLGQLASHIAEIPGWAEVTLNLTEFDLEASGWKPAVCKDRAEALSVFSEACAKFAKVAHGKSDADLFVNWSMKKNGENMLTMPRIAVIRAFIISHLIHHRGQLSVYLRMKDVPLPSVYGPTADAPM
jgi:uncharacterized damage-inducible protein DinB